MKKNKLFLLGLFVVFAAVLSLSLVSNTFAKYVSSDTYSLQDKKACHRADRREEVHR